MVRAQTGAAGGVGGGVGKGCQEQSVLPLAHNASFCLCYSKFLTATPPQLCVRTRLLIFYLNVLLPPPSRSPFHLPVVPPPAPASAPFSVRCHPLPGAAFRDAQITKRMAVLMCRHRAINFLGSSNFYVKSFVPASRGARARRASCCSAEWWWRPAHDYVLENHSEM